MNDPIADRKNDVDSIPNTTLDFMKTLWWILFLLKLI